MSEDEKKRPIETLRDGAIEVAIWPRDTDKGRVYNTQRSRSYQDGDGNWKRSDVIPERDLLRAARLDEKAYSAIQSLRERDRSEAKSEARPRRSDRDDRER